jgi:sarcosine oxidase/L-pipecolate oxidase
MSSAATSSEDRINFPSSVLILGAGVFGLSTAWALTQDARYANTKITLLERAAEFPAPDGSSIDSSRIVRADYPISAYARLAGQAQERWRGEWGADGRYTESGLAIFSGDDDDQDLKVASREGFDADVAEKARLYAEKTLKNVIEDLGLKVGPRDQGGQATPFAGEAAARKVMGTTGGLVGTKGYVNWTSGWAHAEEGMCYLWQKVLGTGRVDVRTGAQVRRLLFDDTRTDVRGVELESGERITADATILALGAWTPKFVDLRGIASSTGQVLAYVNITPEEEARLAQNPVFICYRTGMFIIPPRNGVLKVARHGYVSHCHNNLRCSALSLGMAKLTNVYGLAMATPTRLHSHTRKNQMLLP